MQSFSKLTAILLMLSSFYSCQEKKEELDPLKKDELEVVHKSINLKITDYCIGQDKERSEIFLLNSSAKVAAGGVYIDFDRDGIPNIDDDSTEFNLHYDSHDTNGDGFSDLLIFLSGITAEEQIKLEGKCLDPEQDTDGDGINDCEEKFLGTKKDNFDTDGDGIPDYLEIRFGLDPLDPIDAQLDTDGDSISNINEVKRGTPIYESNSNGIISKVAMEYDTFQTASTPQVCYTYGFRNIPIVATPNDNLLRFYFIEKYKTGNADQTLQVIELTVPSAIVHQSTLEYRFPDL